MTQFAYPYAFLLLALPFALWKLLPPLKGLHGDALKVPFIADLEKISIKSGSLWNVSAISKMGNLFISESKQILVGQL